MEASLLTRMVCVWRDEIKARTGNGSGKWETQVSVLSDL